MLNYDSKKLAEEFQEQAVQYRRYFHQNPELSFQEINTSAFIKKRLQELGVQILDNIREHSVVGVIDSGKPGPNVAFRADMDALPLEEKHDVPYRSQNPGVMHACGHDAHTAILLCLAEAFMKVKDQLRGKVTLLFQQSEEKMPGGAVMLIEDGALEAVDVVFGLHVTGGNPVGTVSVTSGPRMASADAFSVQIQSNGGHASFPHTTGDPVTTAVGIINQLQLLVTKKTSPLEPMLVTVCGIRSNSFAANIIPSQVEFNGMVRCFNPKLREEMENEVKKVVTSMCELGGCKAEIKYTIGYPALINSDEESELVLQAADALGLETVRGSLAMGSEDFARYLLEKPGCFFFVGCRNTEKGISGKTHTADFDLDEDSLGVGLSCMLEVYKKYLEKH